ncbi:MAG: TMEM175 family protein [Nitrososphaerales archaeon]
MSASVQRQSRPRPRIESLSDMIFGLALSIGAISIVGNKPSTNAALETDILTFGFSFLILISIWLRYTSIMSVLPIENRRTTLLNIILLFCVSIEPFLFSVINVPAIEQAVALAYAVDLGLMMLIQGFFTGILAQEERNLIAPDLVKEFKSKSMAMFVAAAVFFISPLPPIWALNVLGSRGTYVLWLAPFGVSLFHRRRFKRKGTQR